MTDQMPPGWENQVPPGPYGQPGHPPYGQPPYGQPPYGQPGSGPQGYGYGRPAGWTPAPAPGGIPLRPLALGDILNGAVSSARRNPAATFGLAAIVMTLYAVASAIFETILRTQSARLNSAAQGLKGGQALTPDQLGNLLGSIFGVVLPLTALILVLSLVLTSALTGMLSAVIGRGVLGRRIGLSEAWRAGRVGPVIGTTLLLLLIGLCVPLPVVVVAVVLALLHLGPVAAIIAVLGGIASVVFEFLLLIRLSVTLPALVLERISPVSAIRRSWELSRGSYWRLFGILLLTEIIVAIAAAILSIPFSLVGALAGGGSAGLFGLTAKASLFAVIIGAIGGIVANTITRPISAGVSVLLYIDLRIRREGLDLALRNAAQSQTLTGEEFDSAWRPPAAGSQPGPQRPW